MTRPKKEARQAAPPPQASKSDIVIADPVATETSAARASSHDRLSFDGYKLRWHGASPADYVAFSGQADLSAKESVKDLGPTPQGLFAVDPKNIEYLEPTDDWGEHRVTIEPYRSTVNRMRDCFKLIRTGMYVHGGGTKGTKGCIEINDNAEEKAFFKKLKKYGKKIELEVKFVGNVEKKLEEAKCPY